MRVEIECYNTTVTAELSDGSDIYEVATVLKGLLQAVGFQQANIDDVLNDDPDREMPEFVEDAVGYEKVKEKDYEPDDPMMEVC